MLELSIVLLLVAVAYIGLIIRDKQKAKAIRADDEVKDAEHANDILTKSITRPDERVRKLDEAGYRD